LNIWITYMSLFKSYFFKKYGKLIATLNVPGHKTLYLKWALWRCLWRVIPLYFWGKLAIIWNLINMPFSNTYCIYSSGMLGVHFVQISVPKNVMQLPICVSYTALQFCIQWEGEYANLQGARAKCHLAKIGEICVLLRMVAQWRRNLKFLHVLVNVGMHNSSLP